MAQQEEGWPLGLQPLNVRVGLVRHRDDFSGSISFNTLVSASISSSTDSSSDLDTESTGSFFHDKSITLGSLIGVSSMLDHHLPRRSMRGRKSEALGGDKKSHRTGSTWCFSLCPRDSTDAHDNLNNNSNNNINNNNNNAPSLGHFLAVERRAANGHTRNLHSPIIYGPDELALAQPGTEPNSLFVNGCVAPPRSSPWSGSDEVPVPLFSCMCGH